MDWPLAHRRAQDAFAGVLAGVTDDDLDRPTPCTDWDVRQLLTHVVAGNWLSAGRPGEPFATDDAAAFVASFTASTGPARDGFDAPGAVERDHVLPRRTIPGPVFVGLRTTDLLIHAWDLARATGQPTDLDTALVAHCDSFARRTMTSEFRGRHFAPARPAPPDGTAADVLAAFLGRIAT
ncbi:MAG: TIGR03086 family metal-binding protein [Ilumatobacteraceae bacterium]